MVKTRISPNCIWVVKFAFILVGRSTKVLSLTLFQVPPKIVYVFDFQFSNKVFFFAILKEKLFAVSVNLYGHPVNQNCLFWSTWF